MGAILKKYNNEYLSFLLKNKEQLMAFSFNGINLFQRQLIDKDILSTNRVPVNPNSIPLFELNWTIEDATPPVDLLMVNCNPAGTDYKYYNAKKQNDDICCYDCPENKYLTWGSNLVSRKSMACIDVFPVVCSRQDILKHAIAKEVKLFQGLLSIFWNLVFDLDPNLIAVTNAFAGRILSGEDGLQSDNHPGIVFDAQKVCYSVAFPNGRMVPMICGGMIAGRHQMDSHSRMRFERDIKQFLL